MVLTAHAKMRKFEQPDEMGAYDRWEMKLSKGVAPMVKEWADMVLFCNYKTMVVNVDGQGAQKGKNKAQGGRRVMHTTHHSCWDAKNRYGLPDEVPFEYDSIRHIIEITVAGNPVSEEKKTTPPLLSRNRRTLEYYQSEPKRASKGRENSSAGGYKVRISKPTRCKD